MLVNRLVSGIWILYLSVDYAQSTIVKDVHPWDLLIYTQNWPVTVCKEWKEKDQSHTCAMPAKKDSWSIHGIWPTKLGTIGPAFCNRSWHFDPEEIRPIETTLTQFWTNVEKETSTYALWAHEWTKHGTCAAILEPLSSELKYFSKGLEWFQKFGMSNILSDAGIIPSNQVEYTIESIHDAVKSRLGINPAIECKKENGKNYIVEIRICFSKNLELLNCDGIVEPRMVMINGEPVITNCDKSVGVTYLQDLTEEAPPNKLYVQLYKLVSWLQWFTL